MLKAKTRMPTFLGKESKDFMNGKFVGHICLFFCQTLAKTSFDDQMLILKFWMNGIIL